MQPPKTERADGFTPETGNYYGRLGREGKRDQGVSPVEGIDRLEKCGFYKIMTSTTDKPATVVVQILEFQPEGRSVILSDGIYKDSLMVSKSCSNSLFSEAKAFDVIWAKACPKGDWIGLLSWELIYSGLRQKIGKPEVCPLEPDDMRYPPGNYTKCMIDLNQNSGPIVIEESADESKTAKVSKIEREPSKNPEPGSYSKKYQPTLNQQTQNLSYLNKRNHDDPESAQNSSNLQTVSEPRAAFKYSYDAGSATATDQSLANQPGKVIPAAGHSKFSAYQRHTTSTPTQMAPASPVPGAQQQPHALARHNHVLPEPHTPTPNHSPYPSHHQPNHQHAQQLSRSSLTLIHSEGFGSMYPDHSATGFEALYTPFSAQHSQSIPNSTLECTPLDKLSISLHSPQILCRLESLTPLTPYKSPLGPDKYYFKCLVFDQFEKILLTFFDPVSQNLRDKLEEGSLYIFSKGDVQTQKKEFSVTKSPFQVTFGKSVRVVKVPENVNASGVHGSLGIPKVFQRDVYMLKELEDLADGEVVTVVGVVDSVVQFTEKEDQNNRENSANQQNGYGHSHQQGGAAQQKPSRSCYLVRIYDESKAEITVKFWDNFAGVQDLAKHTVVMLLNLRLKVQQTNSRRLDSTAYTKIIPQSAIQLSDRLENLLEFKSLIASGNGPRPAMTALTILQKKAFPLRTISEIYSATDTLVDGTALEDKMFFECQAHISDFGNQMYYESCPLEQCQKKIKMKEGGQIECPNCGLFSKSIRPEARFVAHITFSDHTGNLSAVFHQESIGKALIGMSANEVRENIDKNEPEFRRFLESRRYRLFTFGIISKLYDTGRQKIAQHRILYVVETALTPHKIKDLNKQMIERVRRSLNLPDSRYLAEENSRVRAQSPRKRFASKFEIGRNSQAILAATADIQRSCDWEDSMR